MSNISQWSTTASSNNATPPDGWPENMATDKVNDSARENMAATAKWYKDMQGTLTTTGSGGAYVLTTNSSHAALTDLSPLVVKFNHASPGASTLNVDSLGAKSIVTANGSALAANSINANDTGIVVYNSTLDKFVFFTPLAVGTSGSTVPKLDGANTWGAVQVFASIDMNGTELILDADGDTSLTSDSDDRIDVRIGGTDAIRIGHDATNSTSFFHIDPGAITAQANTNFGRLKIDNTNAVTIPAGTTSVVSSLYLEEPNITVTGTVTSAATFYILNAPTEGTNNYGIFVDNNAQCRFSGTIYVGKASADAGTTAGSEFLNTGIVYMTRDGGVVNTINRLTNDGSLVNFKQDGTLEGYISVSGTTVSYNGAHLSRWSQLKGLGRRRNIKRGTVMSSVDEMCEWWQEEYDGNRKRLFNPKTEDSKGGRVVKEDNEQLVRVEISRVKGDKRVYGIFDVWDDEGEDDDDEWEHDMIVAATGDFIVRVTGPCNGGDLLMSNGDGTAVVQPDDIVRSSTIGKVSHGFPDAAADEENLVPVQLLIG